MLPFDYSTSTSWVGYFQACKGAEFIGNEQAVNFSFSVSSWFGDRKGIRPVKKLGVGLLVMTI